MTELDFIFARGNLAILMNASKPVFNTKGKIHIREGRHPLLDKKKVVPITVTLGDTFDLLIVTGPNTGGKTVSLNDGRIIYPDGSGRTSYSCAGPFGTGNF